MSRRVKREGKYSGLRDDGRPFPEILVGITEIAAYLRKSPRAISRWINEGMLPAPKDAKGRRWTTKGVIDQLVLQIYKAEMEHRPRGGRIKVKGTQGGSNVIKIKPGLSSKQERASCPYCGVYEGEHNTGCLTRKIKPASAEPTVIEPLEVEEGRPERGRLIITQDGYRDEPETKPGFGQDVSFKPKGQELREAVEEDIPLFTRARQKGELMKGKLIICDAGLKGQPMLQVEGTLTEKDKDELREWWKDRQPRVEDEGEIEHQERPV